jgi:hypothetical protein
MEKPAMNLRILKKKSKQAEKILRQHYDLDGYSNHEVFKAVTGENYHGTNITCKCKPSRRYKKIFGKCECEWHPLKGTMMIGAMEGYYEPEWHERTLFGLLQESVMYGDKPETMNEKTWKRTLAIAQVKPLDLEHIKQWMEQGQ